MTDLQLEDKKVTLNHLVGDLLLGGFKDFVFGLGQFGEMIQFDDFCFQLGLKPPTSFACVYCLAWVHFEIDFESNLELEGVSL